MKILLTGGCGYVGTALTNSLVEKKIHVDVVDTCWFGNKLKKNRFLKIFKIDLRNLEKFKFKKYDAVLHLANIANDPAVDLNPMLSWEVNVLSTYKLLEKASEVGVKKFIFASSGSVYGVKHEKKVVESLKLVPISAYNKTKMIAERVIESFSKNMKIYNIRPATVCGYSPKMRFDLTVNMLTLHGIKNNLITIFGGNQIRPNIHIKDLINVYEHFLFEKLPPGTYNAGFENLKVLEIGRMIQNKLNCKLVKVSSNDPRSYRQDSTKLLNTGFKKKYSVNDAIEEIIFYYKKKILKDHPTFHTVKWMKDNRIS